MSRTTISDRGPSAAFALSTLPPATPTAAPAPRLALGTDYRHAVFRPAVRQSEAPPRGEGGDPAANARAGLDRLRPRLADELAAAIGAQATARAAEDAGSPTKDDVDRAVGAALRGNGRPLGRLVAGSGLPRTALADAVRAALGEPAAEPRRPCAIALGPSDRAGLATAPGGCATVAGATLNLARSGLVKAVSTTLAYIVKEAIVVLFIEALGSSGLDFFWRSFMGNLAAMLYYGFGYDELRGLVSDNLNACFLGPTYGDDRGQDFRWRTWGDFATDRLPNILFTPAAEGLMGVTGVDAEDELVLYVLSKIAAKSMASFAVGFTQSGLRRAMPGTYRRTLRQRREPNVLRSTRSCLRKLDERFSGERRFRSVPEVAMKLFVYPVSYALTALLFATAYPLEETAAGYDSDVQKRYLEKLSFYLISTALSLLLLFAGRWLQHRSAEEPEEEADIENPTDATATASTELGSDASADDDFDGTDDPFEEAGDLSLLLSALVEAAPTEDGSDGAPAGLDFFRAILAGEGISEDIWSSDDDIETDEDAAGGLSEEKTDPTGDTDDATATTLDAVD